MAFSGEVCEEERVSFISCKLFEENYRGGNRMESLLNLSFWTEHRERERFEKNNNSASQ